MPNLDPSLAEQLASQAEACVNTLEETTYDYDEFIDADDGIFDCDCNGFVGFVLQGLAPNHYALVPIEPGHPRPRAFEYSVFFSGLAAAPAAGWTPITSVDQVQRGDILAWQLFPQLEAGKDTGHVVFVAEPPTLQDSGALAIRVYDSAAYPHFEDTRGPDQLFQTGVGTGFLNFQLDPTGVAQPTITFGPGDTPFTPFQVGIGRITPFSA